MRTKAYASIFRMNWKLELQYRGAVLGGIICQLVFGLILVSLYRALYAGRPQVMPIETVSTYVWLQQAFFRMVLSSDSDLAGKIRTGDIAYDLVRPLSLYGYYYARILAQKSMGSLLRAVPMLVFALCLPRGWGIMAPVSPAAFVCFLLGLMIGLCCVSALENITMGITMRTLDPKGIQAMLNLLMMILSGNVLPLTLYPDAWQKVITALPYAQLLDAPIRLYTGTRQVAEAPGVLLLQEAWTVVLTGVGIALWKSNQRRLVIQGG